MNFVNLNLFIKNAYVPMRLSEFNTLRMPCSGGRCISRYRPHVLKDLETCTTTKLHKMLNYSPTRQYSLPFVRKCFKSIKENISLALSSDQRNELAVFLYRTVDDINFQEFYNLFDMPDTFYSWFVVVELHVWMLLSQLMDNSRAGLKLRNAVVKALWYDVEHRLKYIGNTEAKIVKQQLKELSGRLPITLWVYDEGLLGTDVALAGALWYKFFEKQCSDPRNLEVLVRYVRYQIQHLSLLNFKDYNTVKEIKIFWFPLKDHAKAVFKAKNVCV